MIALARAAENKTALAQGAKEIIEQMSSVLGKDSVAGEVG
jgi:hypothetical protein